MSKPAAAKRAKKKGTARRAVKPAPATKKAKGEKLPPSLEVEGIELVTVKKGRRDPKQALATIQAAHPDITAESYAIAHKIPIEDRARMQKFAGLYLRTMSGKSAAMLMGYDEFQAPAAGQLFLNHVYTQLYIHELLILAKPEEIVSAGGIVAKIWEEANKADRVLGKAVVTNSTTRLKALALLVQILRLGAAPEKAPAGFGDELPGCMVIPGNLAPEEWAKAAAAEQAALKAEVCKDAVEVPKLSQ